MNMKFTLAALMFCGSAFGQTALTQTTLSAAVAVTDGKITVASTTGISTSGALAIYDWGSPIPEIVQRVRSINTTTNVLDIERQNPMAHNSGAVVVIAPLRAAFAPMLNSGACTATSTRYTPALVPLTGEMRLCSTVLNAWVAGFNLGAAGQGVTAAVASAAGAITPSGPFFHITGTAAITGFNLPVGFHGGSFKAIFDGAATWTAAGNIMSASLEATVAGCLVEFTWDQSVTKWFPSTLACNPTP